jgi:hypothetical protein
MEYLDILSVVVPVCVIAISILADVIAALPIPKPLRDLHRRLAAPFRNFLTLQDLSEPPGGIVDVSASKTRILAVSACLASLSSLVYSVLQLFSDHRESAFRAGIISITWVGISLACHLYIELTDHLRSFIFLSGLDSNPTKHRLIFLLFLRLCMHYDWLLIWAWLCLQMKLSGVMSDGQLWTGASPEPLSTQLGLSR